MFKLNIRVLLAVSVALFVVHLVSVVSAEPARSLRLKPTSRSLRSRLETFSKRQQGVVCENFYCFNDNTYYQCPVGCNSKLFFLIKIRIIHFLFYSLCYLIFFNFIFLRLPNIRHYDRPSFYSCNLCTLIRVY